MGSGAASIQFCKHLSDLLRSFVLAQLAGDDQEAAIRMGIAAGNEGHQLVIRVGVYRQVHHGTAKQLVRIPHLERIRHVGR